MVYNLPLLILWRYLNHLNQQSLVNQQKYLFSSSIQNIMEGAQAHQRNKKKKLKKAIMNQINALKPHPDATPEEAIESLVKQAQFYTNFLISGYDMKKSTHSKNQKRRGHFDEEQEQERQLLQQQQQSNEQTFTRLTEQPSSLKGGKLKHYQLVGLNWMISLYESGLNGILADDMGLGKTIQTISILAFLRQFKKVKGPHIIIAPKITLGNWKNQFQKWLPDCKVVKLIATKQQRTQILANSVVTQKFDVLITSFEGVRICLNYLKNIKWHYIVIDEAHKIKNQQSQLSQLVRKLSNQCKLLLTGTPLQNNLHQLWSLLNFLLPEIFDSSDMFDNWFANTSKGEGEEADKAVSQQQLEKKNVHMIQQLHKILKPFMLRRTKVEVQKSLPGKKQIHIFVGLTDAQHKVYKSLLQNKSASEQDKKVYLNLLMQLRKVCNHPYLFQGVEAADAPSLGEHIIQNCGKMIVLDKLLRKLKAQGGHQVLIFSQMTMVLDILEDYCNYRQFKYCRIDGSTDMTSRDEQIEEFMKQGTQKFVFLLSTRAGGLGINLTSADTVIIYDSDWNPQMDLQAMDRAYRIGQKNLVHVYRLITQNTIQQKIIERQQVKLKWDNLVIQQAKNSSQKNKALSKQEIKEMLQYGASITLKSEKGTYTDEQIDKILQRGENRTNEMNKALDEKIKKNENLTDFSMNSINIFDFMMDDERRKQDQQALDEAMARMLQQNPQVRTRRQKLKNVNYQFDSNQKKDNIKPQRKINLPQFHFYDNRQKLIELLQKQQDYLISKNSQAKQPLTQQQQQIKNALLQSGFRTWLKSDFNNFISASQKYGRDNLQQISKFVGKDLKEIKSYHKKFWERINQLAQKQKIIKQIQAGQQKIANKKHNSQLLQWKASKCYQIDFNQQIYTKFKSKLFTIDADRYLAQSANKHGLKNMELIRDKIRAQPMFRFDFHFRSRTQSQLNKRLQSLYKLIQKEKDMAQFGFDNDMFKQNKKKTKKKKQQQKRNDQQVQEVNNQSEQQSDLLQQQKKSNESRKISQKQRQTLLTNFRKAPETIQIDQNDGDDF